MGTMMADFGKAIGRGWWILLLFGLVSVAFGIMAILRPFQTAATLAWVFGIYALAEAIVGVFALFDKSNSSPKGWLLFYILVSAGFGILAIMNPVSMANSMLLVLAIWLVIAGIFRVVWAIRIRKVVNNEWLLILSGVLIILLGVLFFAYPLAGIFTLTLWIGIAALVYGVFQIIAAFKLRKLA